MLEMGGRGALAPLGRKHLPLLESLPAPPVWLSLGENARQGTTLLDRRRKLPGPRDRQHETIHEILAPLQRRTLSRIMRCTQGFNNSFQREAPLPMRDSVLCRSGRGQASTSNAWASTSLTDVDCGTCLRTSSLGQGTPSGPAPPADWGTARAIVPFRRVLAPEGCEDEDVCEEVSRGADDEDSVPGGPTGVAYALGRQRQQRPASRRPSTSFVDSSTDMRKLRDHTERPESWFVRAKTPEFDATASNVRGDFSHLPTDVCGTKVSALESSNLILPSSKSLQRVCSDQSDSRGSSRRGVRPHRDSMRGQPAAVNSCCEVRADLNGSGC